MGMSDAATTTESVGTVEPAVAAFVFLEARLADESRYQEWEGLWDDDNTLYWVPRREGADPDAEVSYIYDNRRRLASRIRQLSSGVRHAQTPPSKMRRLLANLEVTDIDASTVTIGSNFVLYEYRQVLTLWAGRYLHRIRRGESGLRLVEKHVHLINGEGPLPNMAFLI